MTCTCSPHAKLQAAHPTLWAIKTYLDLITKSDPLTYGDGLKRLWTMSAGSTTLNDEDVEGMTNKAIKLGLIPHSLNSFLRKSIVKNCYIYGTFLSDSINDRIIGIANGDIENQPAQVRYDPSRGRRAFYTPTPMFMTRLQRALKEDNGTVYHSSPAPSVTLENVALETNILLADMQRTEGSISPHENAYGAIVTSVEKLLSILRNEAIYDPKEYDSQRRAGHALKILWFIAKLLNGDLTTKPAREDLAVVDLENKLQITDGTLAAIPFPIRQSIDLFQDYGTPCGVSMKGRTYLAAVAAAAFHRCRTVDEG